MMYFEEIHCHGHSAVRKSAQMKWPFYIIRAHRSILHNLVDVEGHSSSGRYCSHHTISPQMLPICGLQQCTVQPLDGNVCPKHACFECMRQMITSGRLWPSHYSCWPREVELTLFPKVTMGTRSRTRSWLIELVDSSGNHQSRKGRLSLVNFSEHGLLFKSDET